MSRNLRSGKTSSPGIHRQFATALLVVLISALCAPIAVARAASPPQPEAGLLVLEILVQGAGKIGETAVRARIGSRVGAPYDPQQVSRDLSTLYELGSFEDIKVEVERIEGGVRLSYWLFERPLLRAVSFAGNHEISADELRKNAAIPLDAPYDPVAVAVAVERLRAGYRELGYYQVQARSEVEAAGEGQVKLKVSIEEGVRYRLVEVALPGVKALPLEDLLHEMQSRAGGFSWMSDSGKLKLDVLKDDRQRLVNYYQDRGYFEVQVGEPVIARDDESHTVLVTIQIKEGLQYRLGTVALRGDDLVSLEEINELVGLKAGDLFNRSAFARAVAATSQRYTNRGYAFVKLDYATRLDPVSRTIDVVFLADRGPEARFGRIAITGNSTTRDRVIRRALTFSEGDLFSSEALGRSRQKVMNLGLFSGVHIAPQPRDGNTIDIDVAVKERPTGALTFGVGYSTEDHLSGQIRLSESNLFGRGQTLALTIDRSKTRENYSLSFNQPSLYDSAWSFGFSLFSTLIEYEEYDRKNIGGQVTLGRAIGENTRGFLSFGNETVDVTNVDPEALSYINEGQLTTNSLRLSFVRDTRDYYLNPTRGNHSTISYKYAGGTLGGDNYFTKLEVRHSTYVPLFWKLVWMIHGEFGQVANFGGRELPFYERYFPGGILSMRGFPNRGVGPKNEEGKPTGGVQQLYFNTELTIPVIPSQGFGLVLFYDTGNAYEKGEGIGEFRKSAGFGIRWLTPIGPLRFEWGYILDRQPGEPKREFAFMIGNFF